MHSEVVQSVHHWNDTLFSFKTTRSPHFRFENGQFVMVGLTVDGRPLLRAYSIVSPNYQDHLEFLSIKVPDGPLTSRLQNIHVGETVLVVRKPTGTLLISDLRLGENLYLLCTGTGLAPFMSIIQDPATYDRFNRVVLVHGVRYVSELAYRTYISEQLPEDIYLREWVREKLLYYPVVSREPFERQGRITTFIETGRMFEDVGLPGLDPSRDRVMVCGSIAMVEGLCALLDAKGFEAASYGNQGDYVFERAFVSS